MSDPMLDFITVAINNYLFELLDDTTASAIADDIFDLYTGWFVDDPAPEVSVKFVNDDFIITLGRIDNTVLYRLSEFDFPNPQPTQCRLSEDAFEILDGAKIPFIAEVGTTTLLSLTGELNYLVRKSDLEDYLGSAEAVHVVLKYGV